MTRTLKSAAALVAIGGLATAGCQNCYSQKVDPCWPERYNHVARAEVLAPFANHVGNGEGLDHTLFNFHFEAGSEQLTPGGQQKLDYLTRRRPAPPSRLYLQTARDVAYDPAPNDKTAANRSDLDAKRLASVQKYLAATTAARGLTFEIQVIDPADQTMNATGPANAVRGLTTQYQSTIEGAGGVGATGSGGGAAPGTRGGSGGGGGGGSGSGGGSPGGV